jgi:pimeloyl-ACP methyl ester carboxylesterase
VTAEEILEVAGIRVLVRVAGEGQPVLLIHGLGSHTMMWARVERAWSGLRLVSFDAPGVGRSPTRFLAVCLLPTRNDNVMTIQSSWTLRSLCGHSQPNTYSASDGSSGLARICQR